MPKFTFVCEHEDYRGEFDSKITFECNKETLFAVVEEFERFLKGSGFVFEGQLDIVSEDVVKLDEQLDECYADKDLFVSRDNMSWSTLTTSSDLGDYDTGISFSGIPAAATSVVFDPSELWSNQDIQINLESGSTQWPFPNNERPQ